MGELSRSSEIGAAQAFDILRSEVRLARTVTHRNVARVHDIAEVYALGLVLYELFTGRPRIDGRTVSEVSEFHQSGQRKTLLEVRPEIDPDVAEIIERCLDADPANRPPGVRDVRIRIPIPSRP